MKSSNGLAYEIQKGSNKPVIFIHGWLGSRNFWKLITPYFDFDRSLVFYDQRCHGDSECSKFDMESLASDLNELIEELKLREPIIVGHSMGGMTALKYAAKYDNLSSLCLLGTSASTPNPENKSVKYFLDRFDMLDREEWAKKITENYVGQSENKEVKEMTQNELENAHKKPVKYGLEAMIEYNVIGQLESLDIPALVIAAENDGAITMNKSRELAELLGCELKMIDTSHQMLPEKPEKIARLISDFLNTELN